MLDWTEPTYSIFQTAVLPNVATVAEVSLRFRVELTNVHVLLMLYSHLDT